LLGIGRAESPCYYARNYYPIATKFTARQLGSHEDTKTRRKANWRGGSDKEWAIDQIT